MPRKKRMLEPRVCQLCGRMYRPLKEASKYCSMACAVAARRSPGSRRRPAGMSDVRWRIELRRRQDPNRYAHLPPPEEQARGVAVW